MFHCNGWCFPWTMAANAGTNVCLRKVEAEQIFELIKAAQGHALLRRADRALDADQRARGAAAGHRAQGVGMVAAAAPPAAMIEGMEQIGFDLTHVYGLTETYGPATVCAKHDEWERARHRASAPAQRPPGRALPDGGGARGDGPADHAAGARGRRDHGRDHVPRQHHHEGLPEEPEGDAGGLRRRLVPFRRPGGDAARRLRQDQGPLQGHHHLRRREHLLARSRGRALPPSRRCWPRRWWRGPTRSGARRPAPSSS